MIQILGLKDYVRQRLSPMRGVLPGSEYRKLWKVPPITAGKTVLFGQDIDYSDGRGFVHSVYELFYEEVYKFQPKTDAPHIIDAGANVGLSILYFKRAFPKATIVAYEPDAEIYKLLQKNVAGLTGVELHNAAAWTEDTELTFYSEGSLAGSITNSHGSIGESKVKAERLAAELRRRPVDFLKIDIEGAEHQVLADIEPELGNVDALFFEYHSTAGEEQRLTDLLQIATRAGYRYSITDALAPPHPFVTRPAKGFDLQLNVSCYRP